MAARLVPTTPELGAWRRMGRTRQAPQPAAWDRLVRAQNRHQHEQEAERGRTGGDAVGVRANALEQRWSRARSANRGRVVLLLGARSRGRLRTSP